MKILSYFNETKSFGITYVRGSGLGLEVYVDADYAEKANDRRSVSGIAVTSGGAVVSHASKTQHVVCRIHYGWGRGQKKLCLCVSLCRSLRPRRVGQALRSLRATRGLRC